MRRIALILSLLIGLCGSSRAYAGDACVSFIDHIRTQTWGIVSDQNKDFTKKHDELAAIFESSVDINWLARNSAGQYWEKADSNKRKEYSKVYGTYLVNYYVGAFDADDLAGIKAIKLTKFKKIEDNVYRARMTIDQKDDEPIDVDLHLVDSPEGTCLIRDFTVEGVSIAASQHEEIQSIGKIGGLELITEKLAAYKHKN